LAVDATASRLPYLFLATNAACRAGRRPRPLFGLAGHHVAALPSFGRSLLVDAASSALLFGTPAAVEASSPAMRGRPPAIPA